MSRIVTLDYLRGLCAFAIMIYHYLSYSYGSFDSGTFWGRIGIYGVSIFYVLSGLTLYEVYKLKFNAVDFYIKRLFRIFPLMWIVMLMTILLNYGKFTGYQIAINLTGLFSVLGWDEAIGTGVWSIGNELFFYMIFPALLLASRSSRKWVFIAAAALPIAVYFWFAFQLLTPDLTMSEQRSYYFNPLNQAGLFVIGICLGRFSHRIDLSNAAWIGVLVASVLVFSFYPSDGDRINLLTGVNRVLFTGLTALICLSFYKLAIPGTIKPLSILGEASYSIYLVHPLVWTIMHRYGTKFLPSEAPFKVALCVLITLVVSYAIYVTYERFFIKLGRTASSWSLNSILFRSARRASNF